MIALDLARALDPALFMESAGFPPDPWQSSFLRSAAPRSLLLCSRQSGKSTVTAALASHVAIFEAGALVLVLAPSQQQSRELFRKVLAFHREAAAEDPEAESAQRVELPNGSRIVSLSGNPTTVRGFSGPRLVILDEAAWIEDELFHAVTPMLAAGGRLIAMTTPFGRREWFYDAWTNGGEAWHRTRVSALESPRLTPEFLALERASKPEWRYRQEYLCEFVDTDEQLFGSDLIARAITASVAPLPSFAW
jgi:Terminase large subunit, T4likevirus-type, N-terminal